MTLGMETDCVRTAPLNDTNNAPSAYDQIAIYDVFNPLQMRLETIPLNRAKDSQDPEGVGIGIPSYIVNGKIFVYGSGIGNRPPKWMELLRMSGWSQTRHSTVTAPVVSSTTLTEADVGTGNITSNIALFYVVTTQAAGLNESVKSAEKTVTLVGQPSNVDFAVLPSSGGAGSTGRIYRGIVSGGPYNLIGEYGTGVALFTDDCPLGSEVNIHPPITGATDDAVYKPESDLQDSGTIEVYLNSWKHISTGTRGTMDFTGQAGALFEGNFNMQGVYQDATVVANPSTIASPGIPPRVCGIGMVITPVGISAITPKVKSVGFSVGAQPQERRDANETFCLVEYAIVGEYQGRITATVEVSTVRDYLKDAVDAKFYTVEFTIGSGAGRRVKFLTKTAGAQLVKEPTYGDDNGIRTYELEFTLTGLDNDYASVQHY